MTDDSIKKKDKVRKALPRLKRLQSTQSMEEQYAGQETPKGNEGGNQPADETIKLCHTDIC
ncbi:MAG: hypothetical protein K2X77_26045 [Candidatus Obscuribacterales bacterium]|jgi:hypothetical protein|nr:hypothetical protein [Candidatus Obscuribacterales bacterium]